ncbi:ABC transporter transmembrane domain-containing protein, partial [Saccharospirillum sp.]|uniref:ABC transporter transmembrane domain-containing protein n=1 Tax=Saccharospirillum sp. TaxID=2033801 RepID=UPI0034A03602
MTKRQFILHYFLLNKWSYLVAVICIFLVNWLQVEIPRYIQQAIDLLGHADHAARGNLNEYVLWVVAFSLIMVGVRIMSRMYALNPGRITEAQLKNDLFYRLNRLPDAYHQQFQSGKLISIINNDMNGIRLFYGIGFLQSVNVVFALSLTPIWMWRISPSLMLYSVIPVVLAFIVFNQG